MNPPDFLSKFFTHPFGLFRRRTSGNTDAAWQPAVDIPCDPNDAPADRGDIDAIAEGLAERLLPAVRLSLAAAMSEDVDVPLVEDAAAVLSELLESVEKAESPGDDEALSREIRMLKEQLRAERGDSSEDYVRARAIEQAYLICGAYFSVWARVVSNQPSGFFLNDDLTPHGVELSSRAREALDRALRQLTIDGNSAVGELRTLLMENTRKGPVSLSRCQLQRDGNSLRVVATRDADERPRSADHYPRQATG
jgi:hypothetical protein